MYDSHLLGLVLRMILIDRREIDKKKSHTHKIGSFEPNQNGIWASKVEKYEMDRGGSSRFSSPPSTAQMSKRMKSRWGILRLD